MGAMNQPSHRPAVAPQRPAGPPPRPQQAPARPPVQQQRPAPQQAPQRPAAPPRPAQQAPQRPAAPPRPQQGAAPQRPAGPGAVRQKGAPGRGAPAQIDVRAMFQNIGSAERRQRRQYIRPGNYLLKIELCEVGITRRKQKFFAIRYTCLAVLSGTDQVCALGNTQPHYVGDQFSHMLMEHHDSFIDNSNAFISCMMSCEPSTVDAEDMVVVCSEAQPLQGGVVVAEAFNTVTSGGGDFTIVNYQRPILTYEELAALMPEQDIARFFPNGFIVPPAIEQAAQANAGHAPAPQGSHEGYPGAEGDAAHAQEEAALQEQMGVADEDIPF